MLRVKIRTLFESFVNSRLQDLFSVTGTGKGEVVWRDEGLIIPSCMAKWVTNFCLEMRAPASTPKVVYNLKRGTFGVSRRELYLTNGLVHTKDLESTIMNKLVARHGCDSDITIVSIDLAQ
jgi:hypothetical protein